jgi:hypothetical protein
LSSRFGGVLRLVAAAIDPVTYLEKVTKISRLLVLRHLSERLLAFFGDGLVVVPTMNAGMQLRTAIWAYVSSADLVEDHVELGSTPSTSGHGLAITRAPHQLQRTIPVPSFRSVLLLCVVTVSRLALAVEPLGLTEEEFKMYQQYKAASADDRVQAMKPAARLPAIAKDAGLKLKDLQRAVEKGDAAGDVKAKCEANLKEVLSASDLSSQVGRLELDTSAAQAVAYVQWFNEKPENVVVEASLAASKAAEACPVASTIAVWAQDKSNPKARVFQALISGGGAGRIKADKVKDFAETRYLKLFEKVKNAHAGDDLSAESAPPSAKPSP